MSIIIQNHEELQLGSEVFTDIREKFDSLLQKLFKRMQDNESEEGSIDLKLNVEIRTEFVQDDKGEARPISIPVINHKITTQVPVKDTFSGKKDTEMGLFYDDVLKRYVLRHVSEGGQKSIFDEDIQEMYNSRNTADEEQEVIEASEILAIEVKDEQDDGQEDAGEDSNGQTDEDGEIMDEDKENGARGDTDPYYDDYGYDEPC